ncbi:DUF192 domain-containing protein [Phyllobacterium salinisoli]|uniref:DUF192 domain-containing protein n=1 Tax=Phyllobacterium salinisoli TaxID=1899321 RepID=A0A368JY05_9HYPH|nr:DUF192 domain-containing protein [Phyllobacterium salinisoli]RCS22026.1 DUF192 domain-containing protein [Phyllobacterium salinisoli]
MHRFFTVFLLLFFALPARAETGEPMRLPLDAHRLVFETAKGKVSLDVEIADTDPERMRGLMYRTDFPENRAMLFVFDDTRTVMMWMKNTPLSLDMVFVNRDGAIATIRENTEPFSEAIVSSMVPVAFVIELRAGVAKQLGLAMGDTVRHPAICGPCATK